MQHRAILDIGSYLTIGITLVLFVIALFVTGFTHDLLLEAGVFLVSVKLVIMGYRSNVAAEEVRTELQLIRKGLEGFKVRPGEVESWERRQV